MEQTLNWVYRPNPTFNTQIVEKTACQVCEAHADPIKPEKKAVYPMFSSRTKPKNVDPLSKLCATSLHRLIDQLAPLPPVGIDVQWPAKLFTCLQVQPCLVAKHCTMHLQFMKNTIAGRHLS